MLIVCPHCHTQHDVPDDFIGEAGRKVRCSECREIWHAERPLAGIGEAPQPEAEWEAQEQAPQSQAGIDALMAEGEPVADTAADTPPETAPAAPRQSAKPGKPAKRAGAAARPARAGAATRGILRRWPAIVIAASLCLLVALAALRDGIVRAVPQMAGLYALAGLDVNVRGLEFANVATKLFTEGDDKLLLVAGDVVNVTRHPVKLPSLRFALRDADGVEIYSWTARLDKPELEPGETLPFKRRLAAPPAGGKDVQVRFMRQTDLALLGNAEPAAKERMP